MFNNGTNKALFNGSNIIKAIFNGSVINFSQVFSYLMKEQSITRNSTVIDPLSGYNVSTGNVMVQATNATITNLVVNGDFSSSMTGWNVGFCTATASNNIATVTANGTSNETQFYNNIGNKIIGNKYYLFAKIRVTNANSTKITLGSTDIVCVVDNPIQNQWYNMSGVITASSAYNYFVTYNKYIDSSTANGNSMEIQKCYAINLTTTFGPGFEPTKEWMDQNVAFFNGTQSLPTLAKTFTLKQIGDAKDEYNQFSAEYIKRISDVLDITGSKTYINYNAYVGFKGVYFALLNTSYNNANGAATKYNGNSLNKVSLPFTAADQIVYGNTNNYVYLTVNNDETGFSDSMTPTSQEFAAYFNGWKIYNADGTAPYLPSMVPYNPTTWEQWTTPNGGITKDSTGVEWTAIGVTQQLSMSTPSVKTSTKYGLLYNVVSSTLSSTTSSLHLVNIQSDGFIPSVVGNNKIVFTSKSTTITDTTMYINDTAGKKIKIKDIRLFELPTGSPIESDFNTLTADQLSSKYPFNGLCTKFWKKISDGSGATSTLPTASYIGYVPYKMTYQLSSPITYSFSTMAKHGDYGYVGGNLTELTFDLGTKVSGSTVECPIKIYENNVDLNSIVAPTDVSYTEITSQAKIDRVKAQNYTTISTSVNQTDYTITYNGVNYDDNTITVVDDFVGKVSGDTVANPNLAKYNNSNTVLVAPSSFTSEFAQYRYNSVLGLNADSTSIIGSSAGIIPQAIFSFNLIRIIEDKYGEIPATNKPTWLKNNVNTLSCKWYGYGSMPTGNKAYFDWWRSSVYGGTPANNTASSPALLTKTIDGTNSNVSYAIDSNGFCHFLAYTDAARTTDSTLLVLTNHGLVTNDYIENVTRSTFRGVTVYFSNVLGMSSIVGQVSGDTIRTYKALYVGGAKTVASGSTNSTIICTAHGMLTGDAVRIENRGGSRVTKVDDNTFTLDTPLTGITTGDIISRFSYYGTQTAESAVIPSTIYTDYISLEVTLKCPNGYGSANPTTTNFVNKVTGSTTANPNKAFIPRNPSALMLPSGTIDKELSNDTTNTPIANTVVNQPITSLGSTAPNSILNASIGGRTAVNMIKNGNFANGTTNWSVTPGSSMAVNNGIMELLATASGHYIIQTTDKQTDGDKIYFKAKVKATSASVFIQYYDGINISSNTHTGSGQYETLSTIHIQTANATLGDFRVKDIRTSGFDTVYIDDYMAVNLTRMYGAGNEPTLAQANVIFSNYFEGVSSVGGKTITATNLITNGNFGSGTTGWGTSGGTSIVSNNVLTNTCDGSGPQGNISQSINITIGRKYYFKVKIMVTNSSCGYIRHRTFNMDNQDYNINNPVANQWYTISRLITATTTGTVTNLYLQNYSDNTTANGKVMQVQQVIAIDLTALFGATNEPTKAQCDIIFNNWFDGSSTLSLPVSARSVGKNLCPINSYTWSWDGVLATGNSINSVVYKNIPVKPNTSYRISFSPITGWYSSDLKVLVSTSRLNSNAHNGCYTETTGVNGGREVSASSTITTSSTEKYLTITTGNYATTGTPYTLQVSNLQLEEGTSATTFASYTETAMGTQLQEMKAVGTVRDTYSSDGTFVKKISDWVTLDGSLTWQRINSLPGGHVFAPVETAYRTVGTDTMTVLKNNGVQLTGSAYVKTDGFYYNTSDCRIRVSGHFNDTGFGEAYLPAEGECKAYFYGWKMCNQDTTTPYLPSLVPYTPSTWAEWTKGTGIVTDSTGVEWTCDGSTAQFLTMAVNMKTSTKYGILYNIVSSNVNQLNISGAFNDFALPINIGNNKASSISRSTSFVNLNLYNIVSNPAGTKIKLKDLRVFELPVGSQIEADFTNLTADQLAAKYTFNGLNAKTWKKITDGTGATTTLPTATYSGYTPYKMIYQLANPVYSGPKWASKTLIAGDITAFTSYTNVDYAYMILPSIAKSYDVGTYGVNKIDGYVEQMTLADSVDAVGKFTSSGGNNRNLWVGFAKGTTLAQMQTALVGKNIYYQLKTPTSDVPVLDSISNGTVYVEYADGTPLPITPELTYSVDNGFNSYEQIKVNSDSKLASHKTIKPGEQAQIRYAYDLIKIVETAIGTLPCATDTASKVAWLKANINKFTCNWYGYGSCPAGNKAYFSIWNVDSSTWRAPALASGYDYTTSSTATLVSMPNLTGTSVTSRIDANGFVYLIAYSDPSDGTTASVIYNDYAELVIALKSNRLLTPVNNRRDGTKGDILIVNEQDYTVTKYFDGASIEMSANVVNRAKALLLEVDLTPVCNQLYGGSSSALRTAIKNVSADAWSFGNGSNNGAYTYGCDIRMWNADGSAWTSNVNSTSNAIAKVTRATTSGQVVSTSNNKFYALISAQYPSDGTIASSIFLDFAKVTVQLDRIVDTVTPKSVVLPKYWACLVKGWSPSFDNNSPTSHKYIMQFRVTSPDTRFNIWWNYQTKSFVFTKYYNGAFTDVVCTATTHSKYQTYNILFGQTTNGMFCDILPNSGTALYRTYAHANTWFGTTNLYIGKHFDNTCYEDSFAESLQLYDLQALSKIKFSNELLSNGSFDNSTGWTTNATSPSTATISNGQLTFYRDVSTGTDPYVVNTTFTATAGKVYRVSFDVVSATNLTGNIGVKFGGDGLVYLVPSIVAPGRKETVITSSSGGNLTISHGGSGPSTIVLDNISIVEVTTNGFTDIEAEAILRGTSGNILGIKNKELFDINSVILDPHATRSGNVITLNATATYQASTLNVQVLPNNKYELKGAISPNAFVSIYGYINSNNSIGQMYLGQLNTGNSYSFIVPNNYTRLTLRLENTAIGTFTFSNVSLKLLM